MDNNIDISDLNVYYYSGVIDFNDNNVNVRNLSLGSTIYMGNGIFYCTGSSFSINSDTTLYAENSHIILDSNNLNLACGSGFVLNDMTIKSGANVTINSDLDHLVVNNLIVSGNFDTFAYPSLPQPNYTYIDIANDISLLGSTMDLRNTIISFGGDLLLSGISSFDNGGTIFTCTGSGDQSINLNHIAIYDIIINKEYGVGNVTLYNFSTGNTIEVNGGIININNHDIYLLDDFTINGGLIYAPGFSGITLSVLGDFYVRGINLTAYTTNMWSLIVSGNGSAYNSVIGYSDASSGNTMYAYGCSNFGNNTNWVFLQKVISSDPTVDTKANVVVELSWTQTDISDITANARTLIDDGNISFDKKLTSGIGDNTINNVWWNTTGVLSSGEIQTYDFSNISRVLLNSTLESNFSNIKALIINNMSSGVDSIYVTATGNGFTYPFNGASSGLIVPPASPAVFINYVQGWTVNSTHKNLQLKNLGNNNINYMIGVIGVGDTQVWEEV